MIAGLLSNLLQKLNPDIVKIEIVLKILEIKNSDTAFNIYDLGRNKTKIPAAIKKY